jgi:hypothetical protein
MKERSMCIFYTKIANIVRRRLRRQYTKEERAMTNTETGDDDVTL